MTSLLTTLFENQQSAYRHQPYASLEERKQRLSRLEAMLNKYADSFAEAIAEDFGCRSINETRLLELFPSLSGIRHAKKHLKKWMKPEKRSVALAFQPAKARVIYQPLGVVGVIVPWNYPLFLAIGPMTSALAAGNHVMVKMSESTPIFGDKFAQAVKEFFPGELITIVNGQVEVAEQFTRLAFDHLLFTGSTGVGKKVMAAAAENLTPITLELGGKSPTILDRNIDLEKAVQRIIIAKLFNAGQTCVAPDYVLVPDDLLEPFIKEAKKAALSYYPDWQNKDYSSIIDGRQYQRQKDLVEELAQKQVRLEPMLSGEDDDTGRKILPRMAINPPVDLHAMEQEIFGPLLPVIPYSHLQDAINWVNNRERPLALYFFSKNKKHINNMLQQTHAGGVSINECVLHVVQENLPFGGIGPSGMGHYHGRDGFVNFSKGKGVFYQSKINGAFLLTPPFKGFTKKLLKWLLKFA